MSCNLLLMGLHCCTSDDSLLALERNVLQKDREKNELDLLYSYCLYVMPVNELDRVSLQIVKKVKIKLRRSETANRIVCFTKHCLVYMNIEGNLELGRPVYNEGDS